MTSSPKTIAFDFDGVIAEYSGFTSKEQVQKPKPEVVQAIKTLKERGFKIIIHFTRSNERLKKYCEDFSIPFDYINHRPDKQGGNPGKPVAYVYVDDRAICYRGQKARKLVSEIENFRAYWEK